MHQGGRTRKREDQRMVDPRLSPSPSCAVALLARHKWGLKASRIRATLRDPELVEYGDWCERSKSILRPRGMFIAIGQHALSPRRRRAIASLRSPLSRPTPTRRRRCVPSAQEQHRNVHPAPSGVCWPAHPHAPHDAHSHSVWYAHASPRRSI